MNPDIDLRLGPLTKALREVVLPALPAAESLAREQAQLVIGHLDMIAQQWKYALRFERDSGRALDTLARELLPLIDDGALAQAIDDALAAAVRADSDDYAAVSAANRALSAVLDRAISGDNSTAPLDERVVDAVLRHARQQARRERIWFAGNGLDPDGAAMPALASLFGDGGEDRD